jgi:hypothetical protein
VLLERLAQQVQLELLALQELPEPMVPLAQLVPPEQQELMVPRVPLE